MVKNEKGYGNVTFNAKAVKDAYSKAKTKRKHPTSVNLPEEVITEGLAKRKKRARRSQGKVGRTSFWCCPCSSLILLPSN
ncbi:MAG: hypothetical protein IPJ71_07485 [Bdellovibrionales bacterium]|nr:hypothetical protein [Bdellovibrionales bacterium]